MNPEIKKAWVEALRSGKYKQGNSCLRHKEDGEITYCCLGVLADIRQLGHWSKEEMDVVNRDVERAYIYIIDTLAEEMYEAFYLPAEVIAWAGLPDNNPVLIFDKGQGSLSFANDSQRTFDDIANVIESQL